MGNGLPKSAHLHEQLGEPELNSIERQVLKLGAQHQRFGAVL